MFQIDFPAATYENFPARLPFEVRLQSLVQRKLHIAYFYENPDNSTFRYRVYNMIQALQSCPDYSAAYFCNEDVESLDRVVNNADVLVICRSKYNHHLSHMVMKAKSRGIPVIYDVDDMIFDTRYSHHIMDTLDLDLNDPKMWDFYYAYIARQGSTLQLCDRVITTNAFLAQKINQFCGKPVSVIPNFINQEQIIVSKDIYQNKLDNQFARDDFFHLGYFSGTPTHNKDFLLINDVLIKLLKNNPKVRLMVVGFLDISGPLAEFSSQISIFPLQDFRTLQYFIGQVEINLVPLQVNEFTNCKSELKYFEAGIVGTVTIASPTFTYLNTIQDGDNGYLAKSYEWFEKIQTVIDHISDYASMAERANQHSLNRFAWNYQLDVIEKALFPSL